MTRGASPWLDDLQKGQIMKGIIVYFILVIYFAAMYWHEYQYTKHENIISNVLFLYKMILYGLGIGGFMIAANFLILKG